LKENSYLCRKQTKANDIINKKGNQK
jgi:hypothetical protein